MKVLISKLSDAEVETRGIYSWSVWTKEVSTFDWFYDQREQCLILEGEVTVKTDEGDYLLKAGDFVEFPQGLKCTWVIKKDIRKYYHFG